MGVTVEYWYRVEDEAPLVRQRFGGPDELIPLFRVVISLSVFEHGTDVEAYSGFPTREMARDWGELRLCEIRAAQELLGLGEDDAARLCRGILCR